MRLKTKLVIVTTALTFAIVITISLLFLGELLRQRVQQTAASNDVLAHEVLLSTRVAIENGFRVSPPSAPGEEAFRSAIGDSLRSDSSLTSVMDAIVRYSPTVQDVYISGYRRSVLVSTDPSMLTAYAPYRTSFNKIRDGSLLPLARVVFGNPTVLDVALPLDRNGQPFLVVHMGVRSTLLRASYLPWLHTALIITGFGIAGCLFASAFLSSLALRPLEKITQRLERLSVIPSVAASAITDNRINAARLQDTVGRADASIDILGEQIQSTAAQHSALTTNLNQILHTLKDGVILFTHDGRAVTVGDAVSNFLDRDRVAILGQTIEQIFQPLDALGTLILPAFEQRKSLLAEPASLSDGRSIEITLQFIEAHSSGAEGLGAMLTLHDVDSEIALEQEIEVSRRLGAIGRLTAGVGHEVKNPINAMVVHLELLRNKLQISGNVNGAQKHVDILTSEMQRLDRVVQTLADFSRPLDLNLRECDLRGIIDSIVDLTMADAEQHGIQILRHVPTGPIPVYIDTELIRQALLNLLLNAMQSMPTGGTISISCVHDRHNAIVSITDTGHGIPQELRSRIFDLYFTTKPRGSGIGLAMTYRILQMHGGAIDLESQTSETSPSPGTTFRLRLPVITKPLALYPKEVHA